MRGKGDVMVLKKGKALSPGDTIGIVAPSSPIKDEEMIYKGKMKLEALGFNVKLGSSCYETYGGYLAGLPEDRARDINDMFGNPEVDAIMCLRGGYGSPHILPLLNYALIAENPKLFIGYSDITAIHTALGQRAGLATVHGPMLASDIADDFRDFSLHSLLGVLQGQGVLGELQNPPGEEIACLVPGVVQGKLVGGNLSLITATLGTPYELDTRAKLLFLEDVGEEPYRIDRMLTQLALAGKLDDAAGFVIGDWADCTSQHYTDGFTVIDLLTEIVTPYQKPTIYNVKAGHCEPTLTLPFGVDVTVDALQRKLIVEEGVTVHGR